MGTFATEAVPKSPLTYELPSRYSQWQQYQREAVRRVVGTFSRGIDVAGLMMPTGTGKSVVAVSLAKHFIQHYQKDDGTPARVGILVGTKFLQDQYAVKDFPGIVSDVRGMGNYVCQALKHKEFAPDIVAKFHPNKAHDPKCDHAPCLIGIDCPRRQYMAMKSCDYFDAVGRARVAPIVVTNYLYYMLSSIGQLDLLICDEAHVIQSQLDQVARIEHQGMPSTIEKAKLWAQGKLDDLTGEQSIEGVRERDKMHRILAMTNPSNWVYVPGERGRPSAWAPIKLTTEASILALAAKHILLMSATLRESDVSEFVSAAGDSRKMSWNFGQYPSPFAINKRPLIHILPEPRLKVGFKMTPFDKRRLFQMLDEIVQGEAVELGHRGIVHSASYQWALDWLAYTKHKGIVHFPKHKDQLRDTVARFKSSKSGAVLLSPSVTTGLDFPGDECRWQVILKVPFPSRADPVLQEREKLDKKYAQHIAVSTLSQALGRGVRSKTDECFTFVLDDNLKWVLFSDKDAPQWVREAYRSVSSYESWARTRPQPSQVA